MKLFDVKFCDATLPNRKRTLFKKKQILYDVGDTERTLFFLLDGFVKVGTVTSDGHEVIYDARKGGDVITELCASEGQPFGTHASVSRPLVTNPHPIHERTGIKQRCLSIAFSGWNQLLLVTHGLVG